MLSWHYQTRDRYLDEAGSYGYLMIVPIGGEALKKAKEKGKLRVELKCDAGGSGHLRPQRGTLPHGFRDPAEVVIRQKNAGMKGRKIPLFHPFNVK